MGQPPTTATVGGRVPRPLAGLAELLSPIGVEEFLSGYWERKPLLVHRDDPEFYADVLTLADVDAILATSSLNDNELRLVADGVETPINELLPGTVEGKINGIEALYGRYRSGATINLMFLHERWPRLGALCRALATSLSAGIHANVYLTPPNSRGLTPHHDTHDVFVMHLAGTKAWTLYPTQTEVPMADQHYLLGPEGPGEPTMEFTLHPGDLVYLPRGTVHAARANESASLHLTIGINPMVWAHVLRAAVDQAVATDPAYRRALPIGFIDRETVQETAATRLRELVAQLAGDVTPTHAVDLAASRMLQRRHPTMAGHLLDLDQAPSVDLQTRLRRRPDLQYRFNKDDEQIHIEFHGKVIDFPEHIEDEFGFIAKADAFCAAEIPGQLDADGRLVLVRQLLLEGFLTLS
jgi:ribosomal protein L16 Arg81 hydroxylase